MRYISIFSGIEAASVAWEPLGWVPMAFCEVDEFPSAVLRERFPNVPNLGDITKVDWRAFVDEHGRPDVLVGGSPCQSFSIAGGRASLDGESRLMYEYIRACDEIRSEWIVWENVPGVLSVRDNAFGQLLLALQDVGYVDLAWRVLDAQFFGVAQRRRRVFLVGRLGAGGGAAAVLFERESVRGNTQTSAEKRSGLARSARRSLGTRGEGGLAFAQNTRDEVRLQGGDGSRSGTVEALPGKNQTYVMRRAQTSANGIGIDSEVSHTVDTSEPEATAYMLKVRGGADTYVKVDGSIGTAGKGALVSEGVTFTIAATQDQTALVMASAHAGAEIGGEGVSPTLIAHAEKGPPILFDRAAMNQGENARYEPFIGRTETAPTLTAQTDGVGGVLLPVTNGGHANER